MKHTIILSSSFSTGERIGYHLEMNKEFNTKYQEFLAKMDEISAGIQYSPYVYNVDNGDWQQELRTNTFYRGVRIIDDLEEYAELISKGMIVDALNISAYILSKQNSTHLRLQKLLYLCYQEYLKETNNKMFLDTIYAYKYGPVVKTVYNRFKKTSSYLEVDNEIDDKYNYLQRYSRIMFAKNGSKILEVIDKVLDKYKDYSASDLVNLTHSKTSAWYKCYNEYEKDIIIPDEIIKKSEY